MLLSSNIFHTHRTKHKVSFKFSFYLGIDALPWRRESLIFHVPMEEYNNLENYEYEVISLKDRHTNKMIEHKFAKQKGKEAIVPAILTFLLDARASTRAKMKNEKDKFKLNIS